MRRRPPTEPEQQRSPEAASSLPALARLAAHPHGGGQTDGRNIDPARGVLTAEGSQQRVESPDYAVPVPALPRESADEAAGTSPTYYGLPVVKEPVWIWSIPTYFFVGGLSGAASVLAAVGDVLDPETLAPLLLRARWTGAIADAVSAGLLTHDLGRPSRFLHMMRVFRPSSPMSVGSWLLAVTGACSGGAALFGGRRGLVGTLGRIAGFGAGLLGGPLAGYTGVLIANTTVPLWSGARRSLPPLFLASSVASAGAWLELLGMEGRPARVARRFGAAGKVAELALGAVLEYEAGYHAPRVVRPLRRGAAGTLWQVSRALTAASLLSGLLARGRRPLALASGGLGLAGALALRFAVFHAGKASARDPRATFEQQRAARPTASVQAAPPRPEPLGPPDQPEAVPSPPL